MKNNGLLQILKRAEFPIQGKPDEGDVLLTNTTADDANMFQIMQLKAALEVFGAFKVVHPGIAKGTPLNFLMGIYIPKEAIPKDFESADPKNNRLYHYMVAHSPELQAQNEEVRAAVLKYSRAIKETKEREE
jgi:hypothetical protein